MNQTRLRERCTNFIERSNITVTTFCELIHISRQFFYLWISEQSNADQKTARAIDDFLNSDQARKLLQEANKYMPVADCAKAVGESPVKLRELCHSGTIDSKRTVGNRWLVNLESLEKYLNKNRPKLSQKDKTLSVFGGLYSEFNVNWKPILSRNNDHEIFYEDRYELDSQYWISDDGTVFNCNTGHIAASDIDSDKYARVVLMKNGDRMWEYVHRLVAYHFCPNRAYKDEVHHIDGKRGNNNAKNLIWVTKQEHQMCHSLMKKSKRDYRKYIKQLKKANQW